MSSNTTVRLGHYLLGKTLGVGSFGKVKLAQHELTGHKVAVKILNRKKIQSLDMDQKVRREIKILKLFMHPHIIKLYEVIDTPTHIFVVIEYVAGGELFDYIVSKGRLAEDEARKFFQQILSGVEYCHSHMVVHRDLKPENLLLDLDRNVKIADFGLSNIMEDGDFLKTSCGSPNYAAPEVIAGKMYAGPEVDVWSCGVILYALLCGSLPFDDENIPNLFKKIKGGIYTLPHHLSPGARDLIPRMLVVDPMKRISMADIWKHPWVQQNLPSYLSVSPEQQIRQTKIVDEEILSEMSSMIGFVADEVKGALSKGERNQMTVAYYLMLDNKKRLMQGMGQPAPVPNSPGSAQSSLASPSTREGAGQVTKNTTYLKNTRPSFRKWILGLESQLHPTAIMEELFRVLAVLRWEWKMAGSYFVKARKRLRGDSYMKVGLQIFTVAEGKYYVDIRRLEGETFLFLDVCSHLINLLQL